MAAEAIFKLPFEIPRGNHQINLVKWYMEAQVAEIGHFGRDGKDVGLGFVWETHTGLKNGGLNSVCLLAKRLVRYMMMVGIISRQAEIHLLGARIVYIRGGEPNAIVTIKES